MGDWLIGGFGPDAGGTAAGISLARPRADGVLEVVGLAAALESPTWLAVSGDHVYATLEVAGQVASLRRTDDGLEVDGVATGRRIADLRAGGRRTAVWSPRTTATASSA